MPDSRLYDTDFLAWTREQAAALRRMADARANTELDLENLAEEIESLGDSKLDALESNLMRVIEHLLKLEYSPAADPRRKWRISVFEHRTRLQAVRKKGGTLAAAMPDLLPDVWSDGRDLARNALQEYDGLDPAVLPADCPYTLDQILDRDFHPPNRHGLE